MKLTLPTSALAKLINQLKTVSRKSSDHPELGNVAIIAEKSQVRFVAMDLDKRMEFAVACKPKQPGQISVNCGYLASVLSARTDPEAELSSKDGENIISYRIGAHTGKRPTLPAEDILKLWPVSDGEPTASFTIGGELLASCLTKAAVQAMAKPKGAKAELCSVRFTSRNGKLCIEATDGRRLIIFYTDSAFVSDEQIVIPRESVAILAACSSGDMQLSAVGNVLTATGDGVQFATKLIEAKQHNFEKYFPTDDELTVKLVANREQLIMELKTAILYAPMADLPQVSIRCDGKKVSLSSGKEISKEQGSDLGLCDTTIPAGDGSGEIEFVCNGQFLIDALNAFDDSEVCLRFKDAQSPFVIKNDLITSVINPMKPN